MTQDLRPPHGACDPIFEPGDLVRGKRNQHVTGWGSYDTRVCPDGVTRATMKKPYVVNRLELCGPMLVVCIPKLSVRNNARTTVVGLFVPSKQVFCWAWDSSLVLV